MVDGYYDRKMDFEDILASNVAWVVNASGMGRNRARASDILGRPFRHQFREMRAGQKTPIHVDPSPDTPSVFSTAPTEEDLRKARIEEKDRERARKVAEARRKAEEARGNRRNSSR